jgi:hypothetical protein
LKNNFPGLSQNLFTVKISSDIQALNHGKGKESNRMTLTKGKLTLTALPIIAMMFGTGKELMAQTKRIDTYQERRSRPRRFRGRVRLGGRLQRPEEGGLHSHDRSKSDHFAVG